MMHLHCRLVAALSVHARTTKGLFGALLAMTPIGVVALSTSAWACRIAHLGVGWSSMLNLVCTEVGGVDLGIHLFLVAAVMAVQIVDFRALAHEVKDLRQGRHIDVIGLAVRVNGLALKAGLLFHAITPAAHSTCSAVVTADQVFWIALLLLVSLLDGAELVATVCTVAKSLGPALRGLTPKVSSASVSDTAFDLKTTPLSTRHYP